MWVRGRSRSMKIAPIDRSYRLELICHCAYPVQFSSYLTLSNMVSLRSRLGVTQDHWKWYYSIDPMVYVSFCSSSNTILYFICHNLLFAMAVSCTVLKIKRDIGRKRQFFTPRFTQLARSPRSPLIRFQNLTETTVRVAEQPTPTSQTIDRRRTDLRRHKANAKK